MDLQLLSLLGVGAYMAVLVYIGVQSGKSTNHEGFVIGNRSVGLLPTATSIGVNSRDVAFSVVFWIGLSYQVGYAPMLVYLGFLVNSCVVGLIAPRVRRLAHQHDFVSPGQMINHGIGPLSRYIQSALTVLLSMLVSAAQVLVLGQILSATVGVPAEITIPLIAVVVGFYLWTGGYQNVIKTDYIQFFVMGLLILVPFFIPINTQHVFDFGTLFSLGLVDSIAFFCLGLFAVNIDIWQRVFSAKNDGVVRAGIPLGIIMAMFLSLGLMFIGFWGKDALPGLDPNTLFISMFQMESLSPILLAGVVVVLFAMGMSTIDSQLYLFTSSLLRDFFGFNTHTPRRKYIVWTQVLIVVKLVLITLIALYVESAMQIIFMMMSLFSIPAPLFFISGTGVIRPSRLADAVLFSAVAIATIVYFYVNLTGMAAKGMVYSLIPLFVSYALCGVGVLGLKLSKRG